MKSSKDGTKNYATFNNDHKLTCHEKDIYRKLEDNLGKSFDLEIIEKDGWKNIRKILAENVDNVEVVKMNVPQETKGYKSPLAKREMLLSYAKDLACAYMSVHNDKEINLEMLMQNCSDVIVHSYERISHNLDKS